MKKMTETKMWLSQRAIPDLLTACPPLLLPVCAPKNRGKTWVTFQRMYNSKTKSHRVSNRIQILKDYLKKILFKHTMFHAVLFCEVLL